eukprot:11902150-Prorocentrum_lima.AAC.1
MRPWPPVEVWDAAVRMVQCGLGVVGRKSTLWSVSATMIGECGGMVARATSCARWQVVHRWVCHLALAL